MLETIGIVNDSENPSTLGSDIELDISSLLDLLPGEERQEETRQVRAYCLVIFFMSFFSTVRFTLFLVYVY